MPSIRLPKELKVLVVTIGMVQESPRSEVLGVPRAMDASVGAAPLLVPLPPVFRRARVMAPAAKVTGLEKVNFRVRTRERWRLPSSIWVAVKDGAGAGLTVMVAVV